MKLSRSIYYSSCWAWVDTHYSTTNHNYARQGHNTWKDKAILAFCYTGKLLEIDREPFKEVSRPSDIRDLSLTIELDEIDEEFILLAFKLKATQIEPFKMICHMYGDGYSKKEMLESFKEYLKRLEKD